MYCAGSDLGGDKAAFQRDTKVRVPDRRDQSFKFILGCWFGTRMPKASDWSHSPLCRRYWNLQQSNNVWLRISPVVGS